MTSPEPATRPASAFKPRPPRWRRSSPADQRRAGASNLRLVLHGDAHVTLSKLEHRFLSLLKANGLPLPQTNRPAGGRRVDCRWPDHHLTVELDSYRYHGSRHAWEHDRRREREAYARGDEFRRYTYGDVYEDSGLMLAELRDLIGGRRSVAAPNVPVEG